MLDGLGEINSWGHRPEQRPLAHDSTNWFIPFSLPAAMLLETTAVIATGDKSMRDS